MATRSEILAAADAIQSNIIDPIGRRLTRQSAERFAEIILAAAEKERMSEGRPLLHIVGRD